MKLGIEDIFIEALGNAEVPLKNFALESQITLIYLVTYSFLHK